MRPAIENRRAFRCSVAPENSAAKLKVGHRLHDVQVLDTSSEGFCIRVANSVAKRLTDRVSLELIFAGERWRVQIRSRYVDCPQFTNIGLCRAAELSKIKVPNSFGSLFTPRPNGSSDSIFLLFLLIAFAIGLLCLPGIGDRLGTAPQFRKTVQTVLKTPRY